MTDALFEEPAGATPLDEEDRQALLRTDIAYRHELNLAEAEDIAIADLWVFGRRRSVSWWLSQARMQDLHKRMYRNVWGWAGAYRKKQTNIGVPPYLIAVELENLLRDIDAQTADPDALPWPPDEIALRFHHRLVSIHPFPNGNGRHARLAADALVVALGQQRFTWGRAGDLTDASPVRERYIRALQVADREGDFRPLLEFARS